MRQSPLEIDYYALYQRLSQQIRQARGIFVRPLTLVEKLLVSRAMDPRSEQPEPGLDMLRLFVDRVAMQDATAQMALLQFMQSGRESVAIPTTLHCDHLIRAEHGALFDITEALTENEEVYTFLRSAAARYNIGFWAPGAGIIHQVILENHALPGGVLIGTDSHTPNAGGLGMIAVGVGGADAAEAMAGMPWEVLNPKIIGVHLTGKLQGWASPKDVIMHLCKVLTVHGGANKAIEYLGPGARTISATGKATICNMGAELGATFSVFPFDENMQAYLAATGRAPLANTASRYRELLTQDSEVEDEPFRFYNQVVEIDLSTLEPLIVGPHSPDRGRKISELAAEARREGWPSQISTCLIGSCTNSSLEDMRRAEHVVKQAAQAGLKLKVPLLITPGSQLIYQTLYEEGVIASFERIGAQVLTNACGPCIGQWRRQDISEGQPNVIVSSFNRNFPARNDGNPSTLSFLTSPEVVVALAFGGRLDTNPLCDVFLPVGSSLEFQFQAPTAKALPMNSAGFAQTIGYEAPSQNPASVEVIISPTSERLQLLEPFAPWDGQDFTDLTILLKAKGQTTTDSISPAGLWLKYRGHLDRISDNMFLGARNYFTGEIGHGTNPLTGETGQTFAAIARYLKSRQQRWVVIGDEGYGEGSSREHAAMTPRYLGCVAIIAKSFERIHETNLKKQGVLPLWLTNPADYAVFGSNDRIGIAGLREMMPGKELTLWIDQGGQGLQRIPVRHTLTAEQIMWFKAGSALNASVTPK